MRDVFKVRVGGVFFVEKNDKMIETRAELEDELNRAQEGIDVLAACVGMLISDGHEGTGIVEKALSVLDGKSGEAPNGRKWSCAQGKLTWH